MKEDGKKEYKKVDLEKVRRANSEDRGGRDANSMSRLQKRADKAVRENLERPLGKKAQLPGVPGNVDQHGSE